MEGSGPARDRAPEPEIDWIAAERSPEFRELVKKRRSFVIPATVFFLGWYTAFVLLAGYAPKFMGSSLIGGLTVGYALALTQFLMVWVLGAMYLRRADRTFDPLARRAAEKALEAGRVRAASDVAGAGEGASVPGGAHAGGPPPPEGANAAPAAGRPAEGGERR